MDHDQAFFMTRFTVLKPDHVRSIHLIFKFHRSRFVCYDLQPRNHPLFPDKKYHRSISWENAKFYDEHSKDSKHGLSDIHRKLYRRGYRP